MRLGRGGGGQYEGASQPAQPGRVQTRPTEKHGAGMGIVIPPPPPPRRGGGGLQFVGGAKCASSSAAGEVDPAAAFPRWVLNLQNELVGQVVDTDHDEEDQCELPSCAPRLLTAGGYNRHHYEDEVGMHVRACLYA